MKVQEAVAETLHAYIAACTEGDADGYIATLAPDVVLHPPGQPSNPVRLRGVQRAMARFAILEHRAR